MFYGNSAFLGCCLRRKEHSTGSSRSHAFFAVLSSSWLLLSSPSLFLSSVSLLLSSFIVSSLSSIVAVVIVLLSMAARPEWQNTKKNVFDWSRDRRGDSGHCYMVVDVELLISSSLLFPLSLLSSLLSLSSSLLLLFSSVCLLKDGTRNFQRLRNWRLNYKWQEKRFSVCVCWWKQSRTERERENEWRSNSRSPGYLWGLLDLTLTQPFIVPVIYGDNHNGTRPKTEKKYLTEAPEKAIRWNDGLGTRKCG